MTKGLLAAADTALVPIADRLRYLQVFRLCTAGVAMLCWVAVPASRSMSLPLLLALTAVYLCMTVASRGIWRLPRRRALTVLGVTFLVDGAYIAAVGGAAAAVAPARYLAVLHLIAVALLASFRTGLKLALWHTLLLQVDQQLRLAGVLDRPAPTLDQATFVVLLWAVTLSTASFAAANERDLRRRGYDLDALARLTLQLDRVSDPVGVAGATVRAVADDFLLPRVVLLSVVDGRAEVLASQGEGVVKVAAGSGDDEIVQLALARRSTLLVAAPDPERDPWLAATLPGARNIGLISLHADGKPLGVLVFEHGLRHGSRIEQRVLSILERFAAHASLSLANSQLLAQVYALATTDALTGLANRRVFDDRLDAALAAGHSVSVVLVDIDHFKRVNDLYGHATGDVVLRHVAASMSELSRPEDVVARYGGEEFAILMPDTDAALALAFAERLRLSIRMMTRPVPVTASLGVAACPEQADHPAKLLAAADAALYASKRAGRNRTTTFRDLATAEFAGTAWTAWTAWTA